LDELIESDDSEYSDTDESSGNVIGEQKNYALFLVVDNKRGVGDTA
jgi:hypothetical protein